MSFRTEMGLYYSYYKTIVHAPTLKQGITEILYDKVTEYPSTINILKRFNIWPEVILGVAHRVFIQEILENRLQIRTKQCWQVSRSEGQPPVLSCEGYGDEHYFYVIPVFLLHGFVLMGGLFYLGTYLSGGIIGGLVTVVCYMFNHGEVEVFRKKSFFFRTA